MGKRTGRSWGNCGPALLLLVFSLVWGGGMVMRPRADEPMAAIFPPWISSSSAFAAMASVNPQSIRGFGGWGGVIIAQSDDPAFADRLYRSGALLVLRASKLTGCVQ